MLPVCKLALPFVFITFVVLGSPLAVAADDTYTIDPATQFAAAAVQPQGGEITIPASDGIVAHFKYPENNACKGSHLRLSGLGPVGVKRSGLFATTSPYGWQNFYVLTVIFDMSCASPWRLNGFPQVTLDIPMAKSGTIYFGDLQITSSGTPSDIYFGPPDENDVKKITFDFQRLPDWIKSGDGLAVPLDLDFHIVFRRQ